MTQIVIEWDGTHMPSELRQLPPGRYVVEAVDDDITLTREEEAGVMAAFDSIDAGRERSLADVIRDIRAGASGK